MSLFYKQIALLFRRLWVQRMYISAGLVLAIIFSVGFLFKISPSPDPESFNPVSYWRERIARVGATAAYEELSSAMKSRAQTEQHTIAHVFGEAMWYEEGIEGLLVCDQRFANGCAHQLVGLEILEKGPGAIANMREVCLRGNYNKGVCLHSIGHGILGYFGYLEDGLEQSIEVCGDIFESDSDPININCYLGVFMEHNTQRLSTDGLRNTRTPTDGNLLASCDQFDGDSAWACMYVLPNWWRFLMMEQGASDETAMFGAIREQCASLVPENFLSACYGGAGYLLAFNLDTPPEDKARLCGVATPGRAEELVCRNHLFSWLSVIYATLPNTPYRAETVCEGLERAEGEKCRTFIEMGVQEA